MSGKLNAKCYRCSTPPTKFLAWPRGRPVDQEDIPLTKRATWLGGRPASQDSWLVGRMSPAWQVICLVGWMLPGGSGGV
jgi:hypothetical protein